MYSSEDGDTVEASVDSITDCRAHARSRCNTIPQGANPATRASTPFLFLIRSRTLRCNYLPFRALETVIQECAPRIQYWKGTIVEGVAKCWVALWDAKKEGEEPGKLKGALRAVCAGLYDVVPSVRDEYARLLRLDKSIFEELVGDLPSLEDTGVSSEVDTSGNDSDSVFPEPSPTDEKLAEAPFL
ncbi:hypothetical protein H4582DRAFT_94075 [Lactarius indigo]|nr:hypothetical protein H4582DRAFT_94075 [Lactarius indigo]